MSDAAFDQALAHARGGRLPQALALIERVLGQTPADPDSLTLKAALLHQLGRSREALPVFEAALAARPDNASAHSNHGNALAALGRAPEAVQSYGRALEIEPGNLNALYNRALVRLLLDDPAAALADARAALALQPGLLAAKVVEGQALAAMGERQAAIDRFDAALAQAPDHAGALQHRGVAHLGAKRFVDALADLDRAFALAPSAAVSIRRSMALLNLRRLDQALAAAQQAVTLAPSDAEAWLSLGVAFSSLARYGDAITAIDRAIALAPDAPLPRLRRAHARLRLGDFSAGWEDYEHRWRDPASLKGSSGFVTPALREKIKPDLRRDELVGRRVLVLGEQGIGDQVMFASMLPDLVSDAAATACACDPRLGGLIARTFPAIEVLAVPPPTADGFDVVLPMGSLGRLYRRSTADFPGAPYLRADDTVVEAWRGRLGARRRPRRIGLSWRGGVDATDGATRSIAPAVLAPLLSAPEIEFVSLQFRPTARERAELPSVRFFADAEIEDFDQLGALALALDGVVSVQTSLVHLCGAVGASCMALIPFMAEWRYGAGGERMAWYGSVELVRQLRPDDWGSVLAAVRARLEAAP